MIKEAKSIAEYAIRKWLLDHNFALECFELKIDGNEGIVTDRNGDSLTFVYDKKSREVYVKEEE